MDRPWSKEKKRLDLKTGSPSSQGGVRALQGHIVVLGFKDTALELAGVWGVE